MEKNKVFSYRYSAAQNKEVENIRKKYMSKEVSRLDLLRALDRRVQSAGRVQGLSLGIVGCLIFGIGICFGLDVFAGQDWLTLLFCLSGMAVMLPAYPLFRHISKKTKAELVPKILQLSEEIMKS